jgi:hypothetical protein
LVSLSLNEKSQFVLVTQMTQPYTFACNQPDIQQQVHYNAAQILSNVADQGFTHDR